MAGKRVQALLTTLDSSVGTNTWYGPQDGRPSSSAPSKSSLFSGLAGTAGEFRPSPHRLASSSLESNGADSLEGRRNREAEARHHIEMRKRLEEDRGKLERDLERFKLAATAQSQAHEELMASGKAQLMAEAEERIKSLRQEVGAMEDRARAQQQALADRGRQLSEREAQFIEAHKRREAEEQARQQAEAANSKAMWDKMRKQAEEEQRAWRAELEARDRREREAYFAQSRAELEKEFQAREELRKREEEKARQYRMQAALHTAPAKSSHLDFDVPRDYFGRDAHHRPRRFESLHLDQPRRQPQRSYTDFYDLPTFNPSRHSSPEDPLYGSDRRGRSGSMRHAFSGDDLANPFWYHGDDQDHFSGFDDHRFTGMLDPHHAFGSGQGRDRFGGLHWDRLDYDHRPRARGFDGPSTASATPSPPFGMPFEARGVDLFGMERERKQRTPLNLSDEALSNFNCVTTESIPGSTVLHLIGPVHGSVIRTIRPDGSSDPRYLEAQRRATAEDRREAVRILVEQAIVQGANGVIGLKFDTSAPISPYEAEIVAYGTAVLLKPASMEKKETAAAAAAKKDPAAGGGGDGKGGKAGDKTAQAPKETFASLQALFSGEGDKGKGGKGGEKGQQHQQADGKKKGGGQGGQGGGDKGGSVDINALQAFLSKNGGGGGGKKGKGKAKQEEADEEEVGGDDD